MENRCATKHSSGLQCTLDAGHEGRHRLPEKHECHWPTCKADVPPSMWGCKRHWFRLPKRIRDKIWLHYVPGQEITKTPSNAYLEVAIEANEWALQNPDK